MKKIILASTSPRRKELLEAIGLKFSIEPSNYKEDMSLKMPPKSLAMFLATNKGKAVADKHSGEDIIIISADTFVVLENTLLGKPKTNQEAQAMLEKLSGTVHNIITGYAIIDAQSTKTVANAVSTKIFFKELTPSEINNYIATGEPMDKAGAYAIQLLGSLFIEKIEGDFFSAIGLPLFSLAISLKKFNIHIL